MGLLLYRLPFGSRDKPPKTYFSIVTILCLFLIQILPILRLHPYYSTYYNPCFKLTDIRKIITVPAAAGLDLAAKYLNRKPNAQVLDVQVSLLSGQYFFRYFIGQTHWADAGDRLTQIMRWSISAIHKWDESRKRERSTAS